MRAVFVNHCHPGTPHICATRVTEFARAAADLGHEIILVTAPLSPGDGVIPPAELSGRLARHDFSEPFLLTAPWTGFSALQRLHDPGLIWGMRQSVIAYYYAVSGGLFAGWRNGVRPYLAPLKDAFDPEIVWTSFGNTDCWNIGRDIAGHAGCNWVGDIKDYWSRFIPAGFKSGLAGSYRDAGGFTALSANHASDAEPWFGSDVRIVYSGFRRSEIAPVAEAATPPVLCLAGATYDQNDLIRLLSGVGNWMNTQGEDALKGIRFVYRGDSRAEVETAAAHLPEFCIRDISGFVPRAELQQVQRTALANLYVKSAHTFHHKTLELMAARRPVICLPGETAEARAIAAEAGIPLFDCNEPAQVEAALATIAAGHTESPRQAKGLSQYSWEHQAGILFDHLGAFRRS